MTSDVRIIVEGYFFGRKQRKKFRGKRHVYRDRLPCPKCGRFQTAKRHDPCLSRLPGVIGACCGHGKVDPYITLRNRKKISGKKAVASYLQQMGMLTEDFLRYSGRRSYVPYHLRIHRFTIRRKVF